jgi:hypothetical protein
MQTLSHICRIHHTVVVARNPPCDHQGQKNEVERAFAEYLVSDVNIAAFGVQGIGLH